MNYRNWTTREYANAMTAVRNENQGMYGVGVEQTLARLQTEMRMASERERVANEQARQARMQETGVYELPF